MAVEAHVESGHEASATGLDNRKLGMWTFLGSECLFFGAMISTYLLYRNRVLEGTTAPEDVYDIPYTSVSSFVLLMSSLTMVLALHAIQRGDHRQLRVWLVATALLGTVFVGGQVFEFTEFVEHGFTLRSSPAGSSFFMLTGFHGAHVFGGVIMLAVVLYRGLAGQFSARHHDAVEATSLWPLRNTMGIAMFLRASISWTSRHGGSSSGTGTSWRWPERTSTSIPARSSRSSATTARGSRR